MILQFSNVSQGPKIMGRAGILSILKQIYQKAKPPCYDQ